jgi:hypothetical protein
MDSWRARASLHPVGGAAVLLTQHLKIRSQNEKRTKMAELRAVSFRLNIFVL